MKVPKTEGSERGCQHQQQDPSGGQAEPPLAPQEVSPIRWVLLLEVMVNLVYLSWGPQADPSIHPSGDPYDHQQAGRD